jgi:hypothetical protein
MSTHHASCQCGQLSADFDGDPQFVIVCNCRACQKRSGSPFGTGGYFLKTQMTVSGTSNTWGRVAPTGRALKNHFCPGCGTTLYWTLEMRPDFIGVSFGTFDTRLPEPIRVIWTEEQHDWINFSEDLPHFPQASPPEPPN